jgi:hypothetical protein
MDSQGLRLFLLYLLPLLTKRSFDLLPRLWSSASSFFPGMTDVWARALWSMKSTASICLEASTCQKKIASGGVQCKRWIYQPAPSVDGRHQDDNHLRFLFPQWPSIQTALSFEGDFGAIMGPKH